ncbi:xylulokinase [Shouchella miscanthi]|uniref:Xylulose kinase n=1 Tax=Shouchella miscanthi TaxID=2598861 RepID=A0ABU6NJR9_9BACI|nr:xylulokinase [Shouchella miscanthi]MED4128458.1 xylulokinase [Shouchella miscanthi]
MKYVIGIDLGTSGVKITLVNRKGETVHERSKTYPLIQNKSGYSEQDPNEWVEKTVEGLAEMVTLFTGNPLDIEGMSFSGQMHGLVLLDEQQQPLRHAILWNDTRTGEECKEIYEKVGREKLLELTQNLALDGFTLPKLLWVKNHEPKVFQQAKSFLLPKDYLRLKLTNALHMDYSDAAGTLLLDVKQSCWSEEIARLVGLDITLFPPLVNAHDKVGVLTDEIAQRTGLSKETNVFAGGADNACGAIGAGVYEEGKTLVSIGTSGVVLSYEESNDKDFQGNVHYFHHGVADRFYTMGVTLAAGYSLQWFKETFAQEKRFDEVLAELDEVSAGANGLLFTPYLVGERTPHADATIRASFIGMDSGHKRAHFVRAVVEGITFSLHESVTLFRQYGKAIETIVSIGGGAKSASWLQIQADIFNAKVVKLSTEQGPAMGAAMLAAYGCGWFNSLKECGDAFLSIEQEFIPNEANVKTYQQLFNIYQQVYGKTAELNEQLSTFRK